ncbi:hypothetical protein EON67_08420 [archaeon]|nr:MAG: hypothetical protein EON67_08420 [archaeon]
MRGGAAARCDATAQARSACPPDVWAYLPRVSAARNHIRKCEDQGGQGSFIHGVHVMLHKLPIHAPTPLLCSARARGQAGAAIHTHACGGTCQNVSTPARVRVVCTPAPAVAPSVCVLANFNLGNRARDCVPTSRRAARAVHVTRASLSRVLCKHHAGS